MENIYPLLEYLFLILLMSFFDGEYGLVINMYAIVVSSSLYPLCCVKVLSLEQQEILCSTIFISKPVRAPEV
jgi:hypothetical protein